MESKISIDKFHSNFSLDACALTPRPKNQYPTFTSRTHHFLRLSLTHKTFSLVPHYLHKKKYNFHSNKSLPLRDARPTVKKKKMNPDEDYLTVEKCRSSSSSSSGSKVDAISRNRRSLRERLTNKVDLTTGIIGNLGREVGRGVVGGVKGVGKGVGKGVELGAGLVGLGG